VPTHRTTCDGDCLVSTSAITEPPESNGFSGTFSFWHLQEGTTAGRVGSCKHPQANPNPPGGMRESPDRGGLDPATRKHPRAVGAHFGQMRGGGVQRSTGAKHGPRGSKLSNSNSLGFFGRPLAPVRGLWAPSCDGATRAIIRPLFLFTPLHLPVPRVPVGSHTAQMSNIALTWLNHMVVGCS
jgi:hypothetical protein